MGANPKSRCRRRPKVGEVLAPARHANQWSLDGTMTQAFKQVGQVVDTGARYKAGEVGEAHGGLLWLSRSYGRSVASILLLLGSPDRPDNNCSALSNIGRGRAGL